jgi:hypothetical protein
MPLHSHWATSRHSNLLATFLHFTTFQPQCGTPLLFTTHSRSHITKLHTILHYCTILHYTPITRAGQANILCHSTLEYATPRLLGHSTPCHSILNQSRPPCTVHSTPIQPNQPVHTASHSLGIHATPRSSDRSTLLHPHWVILYNHTY